MLLRSRELTLNLNYPQVMGILNVTPDSFSDGGRHNALDAALRHAESMIVAGATIIDVGGESTRPGAAEVSEAEELARVVPVVEALTQRFEVWVSVDTSKAAAESGLPVCLMHMQGEPKGMQHSPHYSDVVAEVDAYLSAQIARCVAAGIARERLLLDPGFGFGKNLTHNYRLLANLAHFHHHGLPLLVGMSRKSMVGQLLNVPPAQRVAGSVACAVIAAMQGAQIIRVHDVRETVDAMRVVEATLSAKE
ncbi:TPA: dihydropteroate synthase [Edwardsiella piscicida]